MKMYYLKMLLFTFLINTLVARHYENFVNNHYNVSLIQNKTKRVTIKSRLLAQTQIHNPHYHNDPELKEIIDKMNEEAIKKYQQTHDPYKQLKEVVEKNGSQNRSGHVAEPMSTLEKELLETYVETFGEESNIMLKSGRYQNGDDVSDDSSSCDCTDINNAKLEKTKGRDKYLKHLKGRCTRGIYFCSAGSALLTLIALIAAKKAALSAVASYAGFKNCMSSIATFKLLDSSTLLSSFLSMKACVVGATDMAGTIATPAMAAFYPYGIAALVLLILAVVLIILYIWLYRRRKHSWKHECKKHLCK
ncbi:stevor [Plasmodium falciparum NF54]|uniref:Stevor n=4 Tax=Plasmodium falciparum TaxID=5833 RepID=O96111_PLAF7|nr:stevor [Plasmodium falciparum 3D7]KAF4331437.1 stevor [Plasmodium falciparum NF54]PKC46323.1 stevor [Plasmodium falciparum NF54]CZT98016.1 stevor [Plasmodium falciparum 3D7]|eukprot:XP_001349518.1 stevor [Plasmodium falciparum 3D7]